MVPFINVVLGTMLPMLGLAKHDNIRWVFSYSKSNNISIMKLMLNFAVGYDLTGSYRICVLWYTQYTPQDNHNV